MVPITNSLAFSFTVLGEWWAEGKVISRGMSTDYYTDYLDADTQTRYMDWHGLCSCRNCTLRTIQVIAENMNNTGGKLSHSQTYRSCAQRPKGNNLRPPSSPPRVSVGRPKIIEALCMARIDIF